MRTLSPAQIVAKAQAKAAREHLELALLSQIHAHGLPEPERQVCLIPGRKWAWDFCWPACMVCCEVNGQTYKFGAHSSGAGLDRDYEKSDEANLLGWCCLVFSAAQIKSGYAIKTIREALRLNVPF